MDETSYTVRLPRKWVRVAMIVGVTALIVSPLTALATHTFTDVPNTNTFHSDIAWLEAAGVTKGCNPPANTEYCPNDNVTRGQMAAFMRRLAQTFGTADEQVLDFSSGIAVTSGTPVEVLSIDVTPGSSSHVLLNAHASMEKSTNTEGRYDVDIRRESCGGELLGTGRWRANINSEGSFQGNTLSVTATDTVSGPTTYKLCVSKGEGVGPDLDVNKRGLTAMWVPAG